MKKIILHTLLIPLALFFNFRTSGQPISFAHTYEWINPGYNWISKVLELPDSSFYGIGYTAQLGYNNAHAKLMRFNKYGDLLWIRDYPSTIFNGIDFFNDSTFIVSGIIYWTNSPSFYNIGTAKLNFAGDPFDIKYFGYPDSLAPDGFPGSIIKDLYGGFIFSNYSEGDYGFLKLDSAVNEIWHNPNYMIHPCGIKSDPLGGYIGWGGSDGAEPYMVTRLDSAGNQIWFKNYGYNPNNGTFLATQLVLTTDSNYLVTSAGEDWQLMKIYRNTGDTMWTRNYADTANGSIFYFNSIINAGNNTYMCVSQNEYMLLDDQGDSIWKKQLPFYPGNIISALRKTMDGGYLFSGSYYLGPGLGRTIACFFKTDSMGFILSTGLNDLNSKSQLSFYPNPTSSELYINTSTFNTEKNLTITLTNMQGKIILQQEFDKNKAVDVSSLPNGIYVAEVRGKEKVMRGKVVVQH